MNDNANDNTNFPAIYHNIFKHCEIYPLLDFLEFVIILFTALAPVDLLVHRSVYLIIDSYLPHRFTLFAALFHIARFCAFFCATFVLFYRVVIHRHNQAFSLSSTFAVAYCH